MYTGPFQSPKDNNTQTRANTGQFLYPPGSYSGNFQYPPNEYLATPIPPPPPRLKRPAWLFLLAGLSVLVLISAVGLLGYYLGTSSSKSSTPTRSSAAFSTSTSAPISTPTLDAKTMIHASDFSKFIEAFATAMANKDYAIIQSVTDTQNFQSIVLYAGGGFGTWNEMYSQLTTGNISFIVHYPPLTAMQEGYACVGYGNAGVPSLNVNINASEIQYIVGTASEPNNPGTMQTQPDSMVFAFEVPQGPGTFWLWRAVFFNNVAQCNA